MTNIKIFEDRKIRTAWNADNEEWYFSVVDVIAVLTDSPRPRKYWNALKTKLAHEGSQLSHNVGQLKMPAENELSHNMGQLKSEGSELATICSQLKMPAEDGKMRETDVLDTKGILRLIQSVPSKKAEPFKM